MVGLQQHGPDAAPDTHAPIDIALPDADIRLYPSMFSAQEADALCAALHPDAGEIHWTQDTITVYGTTHRVPRLTAWYGEPNRTYTYSGITVDALDWTPTLLRIKHVVDAVSGVVFNSVLLNLYRDGADGVSWHSDDEPELGRNPVIGSVSFGAPRPFRLKHKTRKGDTRTTVTPDASIMLRHGSYLLMQGPTQHHWRHQIPKSTQPMGPRINLTFRIVA